MNRLVQGEVGSGKTLVALRAMLQVAQSAGSPHSSRRPKCSPASMSDPSRGCSGRDLAPELMPTLLTGQMPRRGATQGSAADGLRPGPHHRRHPRAAERLDHFRRPGAGRRRRAAPVRGRSARGAAREGHRAARARAHRDAHPAHGRDDGVRRPRRLDDPDDARGRARESRRSSPRWRRSRAGSRACGIASPKRSRRGVRRSSCARRSTPTRGHEGQKGRPPMAPSVVEGRGSSADALGCRPGRRTDFEASVVRRSARRRFCTARCRRRRRMPSCRPSPPETSTCSWRPLSSRWASTCRTPRRWRSSRPTGSACRNCTSFADASGAGGCPVSACWSPSSALGHPRGPGRGGGIDDRRLRAGRGRPRAARRGRRARRRAVRCALVAAPAARRRRCRSHRRARVRQERFSTTTPRSCDTPACTRPSNAGSGSRNEQRWRRTEG